MSSLFRRERPGIAGWLTAALLILSSHAGSAAAPAHPGGAGTEGQTHFSVRELRARDTSTARRPGRRHRAARSSHGSALTTAPGLTVRSLAPHRALAGRKVEEFDVSPRGGIVVRIGGALYDFTSGERLTGPVPSVRSFAFVQGALAVVTDRGTLGFWRDGGLRDAGAVPHGANRLRSSESGNQLLLVGDPPDSGVFRFSAGAGLRPVCAAPDRVLATAGEGERCLVAIGSSLFEVPEPGSLSLRMALPRQSGRIVGLALAGDVIYYATPQAVSSLQGGVAIPVVLGIGGPLRMTVRGLMVLDRATGKLYRLSGSGLTARGDTPGKTALSRATPGTLEINLTHADPAHCAPGYTIYVDGKIVFRFEPGGASGWRKPLRLRLGAGPHRVEAAVKLDTGDDRVNFPFLFRRAEADVRAGRVASVTLDVQPEWYNMAGATASYPEEGPTQGWFEQWAQAVRKEQIRAREDPVAALLVEARHRVTHRAVPKGRIWLNLPEAYGGRREYAADQVALLVGWLQRLHWSWAAPLPGDFVARMPDAMRRDYELLLEEIDREKSALGKLGDLADRMQTRSTSRH